MGLLSSIHECVQILYMLHNTGFYLDEHVLRGKNAWLGCTSDPGGWVQEGTVHTCM